MQRERFYSEAARLLAKAILDRDMVDQDAANALGVTPQQISNYKLGRNRPDLERAVAIQKLFDVPVEAWCRRLRSRPAARVDRREGVSSPKVPPPSQLIA